MFLCFPNLIGDPFNIAPETYANVRPLNESETNDYIEHRLRLAGNRGESVFDPDALALVYRVSNGSPRCIDELCSVALKCAFANDESVVSRDSVSMAADRLEITETDGNRATDIDRDPSFQGDAPANQDWAEVSREFGVQNQIIDRLRDEASSRSEEIEELHTQIAELTRANLEMQNESDQQDKLRIAMQSMEEKIETLQTMYASVSTENIRLAEKMRSITESDQSVVRHECRATSSFDNRRAPIESREKSEPEAEAVPTSNAADYDTSHNQVVLSDERVLVSIDPRSTGSYRIRTGRLGLGSNSNNDFPIKSEFVSPHHARIDSDDRNSVLVDLNSTNGTYINGRRIQRRALRDGDEIRIGKHNFRFTRQIVERRPSNTTLAGPGSSEYLSASRFSAHRNRPLSQ